MAASATINPPVKAESKSAKKKKAAKVVSIEKSTESEIPSPAPEATPSTAGDSNTGDYESPYIKDLYKNIRNVNKKITNASRVDNVLAENPGKSLDELVSEKKINADQKAQILKKPALQASLTQLEEQIAQYKKFDQEYKVRLQTEKAEVEKTVTEKLTKEHESTVSAIKAESKTSTEKAEKELKESLLLVSQFLKLAAIRRIDEANVGHPENMALEGLLVRFYGGDYAAVDAMLNLIDGFEENLKNVDGEELDVSYGTIRTLALEQGSIPAKESEEDETPVESDPTIANAGLTEIDAPTVASLTNGHTEATHGDAPGVPQNSGFGDGAANAAAEANWDQNNDLSTSQEWVEVPRDATETDTGVTATPAAPSNTQSWADDKPDSPEPKPTAAPTNTNDGFQEVKANRGRGNGFPRGGGGRGGRGEFRGGRGNFRGDGYRGRGRGGGNRGAPRSGPTESS